MSLAHRGSCASPDVIFGSHRWASLAVGGAALLIGLALLAWGVSRLKAERLVPNKTIEQLQRDVAVAAQQMRTDYEIPERAV